MQEMKNKKAIFNPLNHDITIEWDKSGKNPKSFKLKSKEITMIDTKYINHVKNQLANEVFDARGDYRKRRDIQLKDILKEIEPEV